MDVGEEELEEEDVPPTKVIIDQADTFISFLETKLEGPSFLSFSNVTFDSLEDKLNIKLLSHFTKKGDYNSRAQKSAAQGGDKYMSSKNMYSHLNLLHDVVPHVNEANTRLWIDAMFLRVASMLSEGNLMVLNLEHAVPAVGITVPLGGGITRRLKLSATIDYTALVVPRPIQPGLLQSSAFRVIKAANPTGIFIAEVKQSAQLYDHIPQTLAEMYGTAIYLEKDIIRGALSNGRQWIFSILYRNKDGNGGHYRVSHPFRLSYSEEYPEHISGVMPDIITGILSYWMERGFADLDDGDWFE